MRRKNVFVLTLFLLSASLFYAGSKTIEVKASGGIDTSKVYGVEMLWNISMSINDVAVSKDGNYLVAVNNTGVYYFASNNSSPKWWYLSDDGIEYFLSVATSADGEYVVAGDYNGYIHYFNDSIATTGRRLSPTWKSIDLGLWVERGTLDMSDDGEYVVLGGTGIDIWYFAGCRGRSGINEQSTWSDRVSFPAEDVLAVDMSSDGAYVAAGGTWAVGYPPYTIGFVVFYKNANTVPYPTEPDWHSSSSINSIIIDLALSDDGYAVVAVDEATIGTLYYWANATILSGDANATWTNYGAFGCVDMSVDGDEVVAATVPLFPCGLHFWAGARGRSGPDQQEDWIRLEGETVPDVAISDDGGVIAAPALIGEIVYYPKAFFFKYDGSLIGELDLSEHSPLVSMSGEGSIAVMGGGGPYSLYLFKALEDLTPPLIENVYQEPANDTVEPDDEVIVYANVTDDKSGVKNVILSHTIDNVTFALTEMTNLEGNLYNATIPPFPYCTNVRYMIMAEDYANNTITTEEMGYTHQYHVIPEFPTWTLMLLMIIVLTVAIVIYKRRYTEVP